MDADTRKLDGNMARVAAHEPIKVIVTDKLLVVGDHIFSWANISYLGFNQPHPSLGHTVTGAMIITPSGTVKVIHMTTEEVEAATNAIYG